MKDTIDENTRNTIFSGWARGIRPETLATTYGMSRREVMEVIDAEKRLRPSLLDIDVRNFVEEYCYQLDALIEELAIVASRESGPARIRAISVRFLVIRHRLELAQAMGLVPAGRAQMQIWADGARMADLMLEMLDEHGVLTLDLLQSITKTFSPSRRLASGGSDE